MRLFVFKVEVVQCDFRLDQKLQPIRFLGESSCGPACPRWAAMFLIERRWILGIDSS